MREAKLGFNCYTSMKQYFLFPEEDNFGTDIVTSILRAMRCGSKDARQLFPCLLQLPGLGTSLSELYHKEVGIRNVSKCSVW
jgi:hypothetical protein